MSEPTRGGPGPTWAVDDLFAYWFGGKKASEAEALQAPAERRRLEWLARLRSREDEERRVLGRELRDEASLELLRIEDALSQATNEASITPSAAARLREQLQRLEERCRELSKRLYPSFIDDLGLVIALRSACEAVQAASGIPVRFQADEPSNPLPLAASLSFHRVLDEALRNAVRHAGTPDIAVSLREEADAVTLTVADRGTGFDFRTAHEKGGLGLIAMAERIDELGGRLAIESGLGAGTRIAATVPLPKPT